MAHKNETQLANYSRKDDPDKIILCPRKLPLKAFDEETLPYQITLPNGEKRAVFDRAICIKRDWGEAIWMNKTNKLSERERTNCQVVVIPPRSEKKGNGDFSNELIKDLKTNQISKSPVAILERTKYEVVEYGKKIVGQQNVKSVYIVASAVSEDDLADIISVAQEYKDNGAIEVNLIAPFIKDGREDKNVDKSKDSKSGTYNGKVIKIKNVMRKLSGLVDRIVTYEPHSGATQTFAAINDIALAPISLEEEMIGEIKDRVMQERKKWVVVRPDAGRNLVATRIEKLFDIRGVHLEKLRDSVSRASSTDKLSADERKALKGKNTILYDDEGGTLGTIKDIVIKKFIPARVASINIFLAHARLQKKWRKNLDIIVKEARTHNIPLNIYFSDSRRPLGNLKLAIRDHRNIKIISVKDKVKKTIKACMAGINLWRDKQFEGSDWERLLLQPIEGIDSN